MVSDPLPTRNPLDTQGLYKTFSSKVVLVKYCGLMQNNIKMKSSKSVLVDYMVRRPKHSLKSIRRRQILVPFKSPSSFPQLSAQLGLVYFFWVFVFGGTSRSAEGLVLELELPGGGW